jgi:AcrR family transcriptional regulator
MDAERLGELSGGLVPLDSLDGNFRLQAGWVILSCARHRLSFIFDAADELRKGRFRVQKMGSITEIADESTLNRATFYLHYPDKNALLQAMTSVRFRDLIERRGITFTGCDGALGAIALGVCDYLAETTSCPGQLAQIPLEGSIIPVIEGMFKEGISRHAMAPGVDAALLATTAAWAVFGAARRWFQTLDRIPAEEMAAKIETMVRPVFLSGYE